jgi:tetratricopeptide (TPR) repeat protein
VVPVYRLLHDLGGRPCYVMRFIHGQTFAAAIERHHAQPSALAFRRLLHSFLQACQTVAYAHSRGVIHRDLKPTNIMLGKFGETLVVDWGLAKVVGRPEAARAAGEGTLVPGSGSDSGETALGSAVGTPAYMSPEQAAGRWDVIDHKTDVYGLGAVLYTLLTGRPPLDRTNWPEMQQKIQRSEFPRPRQVKGDVPRPLEAICLRAMAARPEERYPSAAALGADVEHWLADEPVGAYHEPWRERVRRWAKRNRTLVIAGAVLLLAALASAAGGLVLLSAKNREVAGQRNAALAAADEAEAVNAFLAQDLLGQADPDMNPREQKVTVEQVLAKAAAKIDGNPKFADKPAVEATLRLTIGKTYFKLGDLAEAEKHLRRAVDLRRSALGPGDLKTLAAQDTFADFLNLGPGRFTEAEPLARRTWEAYERALGANDRATLNALDTYATAVQGQGSGRADEALALHRKCLDGRRRALGPEDPDTLGSMNNLGLLLSWRGEWDEAVALLRQSVAGKEKRPIESESFACAANLAVALYHLGDLDEADKLLGRYLPQASKLLTADHPFTQHLKAFRARVWIDQGRAAAAIPELREVVEGRRKVYKDGHWRIGSSLVDLGRALLAVGKTSEAEPALAEARSIYQKFPPGNEYYSAWADCCHAAALAALGRYPKAEELLLAAEPRLAVLKTCPRRHYRQVLEHLERLYEASGKPEEAARWRQKLRAQPGAN